MIGSARNVLATLFIVCLLAGCGGGSVNQANFDKVKNDMSVKDVDAILGTGSPISLDEIGKLPLPEKTKVSYGTVGAIIGGDPKAKTKPVQWRKWGDNQKFILVGFQDDKVYQKLSNGL